MTVETADGAGGNVRLSYNAFTSSPNNDCTPPGQELTSLSVEGYQFDPAPSGDFAITLCLPRPDQLGGVLAFDDLDRIQLIDVNAEFDDCTVRLDSSAPPQGTVEFIGYCGNGSDPAGYAIAFDGTAPGERICGGGQPEPIVLELSGRVAIEALVF